MILTPQRLQQIGAVQANLAYPPIAAVPIKHPVGHHALMGAVERAKTNMDDSSSKAMTIVARLLHLFR